MILAAPTDTGVAPAGANVRAVPVVPHNDADSRMYAPPPVIPAERVGIARAAEEDEDEEDEDEEDEDEEDEDEEDEDEEDEDEDDEDDVDTWRRS